MSKHIFQIVQFFSITHAYLGNNAKSNHNFIGPVQEKHYDHNRIGEISSNKYFEMQTEFLGLFNSNEVAKIAESCTPRFGDDLSSVGNLCSKDDFFFGINPPHIDAVEAVTRFMDRLSTIDGKLCIAAQLRNLTDINPYVWIRSLMNTVMQNSALRGLHRPNLVETFSGMFIPSPLMSKARKIAALPPNQRDDHCIIVDGRFGAKNGRENDLWYYREDLMHNAHHWYWHVFNPWNRPTASTQTLPRRNDRRGELFHYMHWGTVARYQSERLSNGLQPIKGLDLTYGTIIRNPYYANLDGTTSGRRWTDRRPNIRIQDLRPVSIESAPMNISIESRNIYLNRIMQSIYAGRLLTSNGELLPINNIQGIDYLGDVVEASVYSVNPSYYDAYGVHNSGRLFVALAEDPEGILGLPPGVMGDPTTALRDPELYTYHLGIFNIFDAHKQTLPPYHPTQGEVPLLWDGVKIENVQVIPLSKNPNELSTFFTFTTYDLSRGLDFNQTASGTINACVKHLDYEHFEYQISIFKDPHVTSREATFRIFMAPSFDENGRRYNLEEQRVNFFALDHFKAEVHAGENLIRRSSLHSTVTISTAQSLDELNQDENIQMPNCGCGIPQHLLLPKGNQAGMLFDLFVMATDAEEDSVPYQHGSDLLNCIPAPEYCGIPGQLYPDTKPMGYPFDRLPPFVHDSDLKGNVQARAPRRVTTVDEFAAGLSNAAAIQVRITHYDI